MISFEPIAFFRCSSKFKHEQPRQAVFSENHGFIEFLKDKGFENGLRNLDGFDRIWIIFNFHHTSNWKALVTPPVNDGNGRKGVFATRSPHRPNSVGLSCCKIIKIEQNKIFVEQSDLLDGTPILDIKPYIKDSDCFPDAKRGWLDNIDAKKFAISFNHIAKKKIAFLQNYGVDLNNVINTQLQVNPTEFRRKRIIRNDNNFTLKFRLWRINFQILENIIKIEDVYSGYLEEELLAMEDPYEDKELHRVFNREWK
ncbi:MAG: tRNA (N6-threonylcarbamoyladenosine(37)-N6)-methyltransferase TrmO [Candidatus Delongbacteria bacterium]|nr:tRNA (N6-threonylcarbamoyladenosine(37)-N6)-methyltransferase TrmO [Candidatus Delongbacteria bacterium]MBN2833895.1 tRNA (N6-threonylcarbamoyladenosine(37)-N6)-methyltransferase TrmO [Candidatus Delongbacteria bacterium]